MKVDLDKLKVTRNEAESTFEVLIDGQLSKLDYLRDGNNLVITHVGVYPEFRGQGVAGKLMEAALEYAKENHPDVYSAYFDSPITNPPAEVVANGHGIEDVGEATPLYDAIWVEVKGQ